ncbi:MAG: Fic family protein [Eubacterium sp.]|nr:Fic family protein [Eubacterium sp.]
MIRSVITNEMLKMITTIEENKIRVTDVNIPSVIRNKLRKNSKKKSSYASNKIEGNPLTEEQAEKAIESDPHRHFMKPEQEIRNYFLALSYLENCLKKRTMVTKELILEVQSIVEKGASREKIGIRGSMPPGFLFAVYDSQTGNADYIPPEDTDIPALLDELIDYLDTTDDHPLIIAAIVHYQLVTIHPFEDGNGRTARLISGYLLDYYGYGFQGIGSLEEYFAYDPDEYYRSLQMGLPALYYSGRENPPHPEIWFTYFLRMMVLYSEKALCISKKTKPEDVITSLSFLKLKEKELLAVLIKGDFREFTPVEMSKVIHTTNRTVINRTVNLVNNGFAVPIIVKERIRSYRLSEYALENREEILGYLER